MRIFHALSEANLDDLSCTKISQILQQANAGRDLFRNVQNFTLAKYQNNPIAQRDSFINQIRDNYDQVFEVASPPIAFAIRKGTDFEKLEEQAKETLQRIDENSDTYERAMKVAQENAEHRRPRSEANCSRGWRLSICCLFQR